MNSPLGTAHGLRYEAVLQLDQTAFALEINNDNILTL